MKISSSSCTSGPPADEVVVVVLFGCFLCGETKAGAVFLVGGGEEMELSGGSLSKADGVGDSFFVFLACIHPIDFGLRLFFLSQHAMVKSNVSSVSMASHENIEIVESACS